MQFTRLLIHCCTADAVSANERIAEAALRLGSATSTVLAIYSGGGHMPMTCMICDIMTLSSWSGPVHEYDDVVVGGRHGAK